MSSVREEIQEQVNALNIQICDQHDINRAISQLPNIFNQFIEQFFSNSDGDPITFIPWGWMIATANEDFTNADSPIDAEIQSLNFVPDKTIGNDEDVYNDNGYFCGRQGQPLLCLRREDGNFEIVQKIDPAIRLFLTPTAGIPAATYTTVGGKRRITPGTTNCKVFEWDATYSYLEETTDEESINNVADCEVGGDKIILTDPDSACREWVLVEPCCDDGLILTAKSGTGQSQFADNINLRFSILEAESGAGVSTFSSVILSIS